jgi:hypothetical protein
MRSMIELASINPVNPPKLNDSRNPSMKNRGVSRKSKLDHKVNNQFKSFMPVGIAIIEVDDVKYALESISNPTANI